MDHVFCIKFLVACRGVARRDGLPLDRGWGVTHTSDRRYWHVQDHDGRTVWEGDSCCAYSARSEALISAGAKAADAVGRFSSEADRTDFDVRR